MDISLMYFVLKKTVTLAYDKSTTCCGFFYNKSTTSAATSRTDARCHRRRRRAGDVHKSDGVACCTTNRQLKRSCQWPVIIMRLYYNIADFMDKFAEFVCWTIPMLYETKTQNAGEFTYFVSHKRGISKMAPVNVSVVNHTTHFAGSDAIVKYR